MNIRKHYKELFTHPDYWYWRVLWVLDILEFIENSKKGTEYFIDHYNIIVTNQDKFKKINQHKYNYPRLSFTKLKSKDTLGLSLKGLGALLLYLSGFTEEEMFRNPDFKDYKHDLPLNLESSANKKLSGIYRLLLQGNCFFENTHVREYLKLCLKLRKEEDKKLAKTRKKRNKIEFKLKQKVRIISTLGKSTSYPNGAQFFYARIASILTHKKTKKTHYLLKTFTPFSNSWKNKELRDNFTDWQEVAKDIGKNPEIFIDCLPEEIEAITSYSNDLKTLRTWQNVYFSENRLLSLFPSPALYLDNNQLKISAIIEIPIKRSHDKFPLKQGDIIINTHYSEYQIRQFVLGYQVTDHDVILWTLKEKGSRPSSIPNNEISRCRLWTPKDEKNRTLDNTLRQKIDLSFEKAQQGSNQSTEHEAKTIKATSASNNLLKIIKEILQKYGFVIRWSYSIITQNLSISVAPLVEKFIDKNPDYKHEQDKLHGNNIKSLEKFLKATDRKIKEIKLPSVEQIKNTYLATDGFHMTEDTEPIDITIYDENGLPLPDLPLPENPYKFIEIEIPEEFIEINLEKVRESDYVAFQKEDLDSNLLPEIEKHKIIKVNHINNRETPIIITILDGKKEENLGINRFQNYKILRKAYNSKKLLKKLVEDWHNIKSIRIFPENPNLIYIEPESWAGISSLWEKIIDKQLERLPPFLLLSSFSYSFIQPIPKLLKNKIKNKKIFFYKGQESFIDGYFIQIVAPEKSWWKKTWNWLTKDFQYFGWKKS